ncbi:hypothetical protein ACWFMI_09765 [Nocardiopsis terrae]
MSSQHIDVNADSASNLMTTTEQALQELGSQVTKLMEAAEPMGDSFSGQAKTDFDELNRRAGEVAADLNRGLGRMNEGQAEFSKVIMAGDEAMADEARTQMSAANFDAAKFR